jgi:phage terminase small subunit
MKGKGIGRFFSDIKEKLRAVSKRDHLNFRPETKISEYTLKDLDEFQERIKNTEKELESAKKELEVLERIVVPEDASADVLAAHLTRKKELQKRIPELEEALKMYRRSEILTQTKEAFEEERKSFVKDFVEVIVQIPILINDVLEAFKTNNPKRIKEANRKLEEQIKSAKRLEFDAAERSALYTRALGEETKIVLPSYKLTEERIRELYITASQGEDKYFDDDNLSRQYSSFIVILESLAPEGFDFDKMRVEEDRKMDKEVRVVELQSDIEQLKKDMDHMRSISVDSPDLLKEYEATKGKVDAFLAKYKDSDLIEVAMHPDFPNVMYSKSTPASIPAIYEKIATDEQYTKIAALEKERRRAFPRPLKSIPIFRDGIATTLKLEDIDPKDFPEYIEDLNKDTDIIKNKIEVIKAIPADSPLLAPSFDKLLIDIRIYREKHAVCYGAEIKYDVGEYKLTVKPELDGVNALEVSVLSPEQIEAYEKSIGARKPPETTPPETTPPETVPEEVSFGDRVKIQELNDDIKVISQKIRIIRAIPEDSPLLATYAEKLIKDIAGFVAKHKDSPFAEITFDMNKLTVKAKKEGVNALETEALTAAQINEISRARALGGGAPGLGSGEHKPGLGGGAPATGGPETGPRKEAPATGGPGKEAPATGGPAAGKPVTDPKEAEKKAFRDKYIAFINALNTKIDLINQNNETLSRMVTYNPDEMELEIATETTTYDLEKELLKDKLDLANMRLEYFKKYGLFILSDPDVLAAKLEDVKFESSKDLEAFVNARNVKIIEAENEIIELGNQIEALKEAKETGYEAKVNESEERIKLLQRFIKIENSIIQRRLVAEGKSIDIAAYYEKRNENLKELRARLSKGGKPGPEKGGPETGPGKETPGSGETPPAVTEEEKENKRQMLNAIYGQLIDKRIEALYEGNSDVELNFEKVEYLDYEKFKDVYDEVRTKWNAIFAERVKEEQLDAILSINKELNEFYAKTVKDKKVPTEEEVKNFIDSIDKKGLNCEIGYDLNVNRFTFKYTHKEFDKSKKTYNEVTRVNDKLRIYDKKLHANRTREVGVGDVKYKRRDLSFSPSVKAQKVDRQASILIKHVSEIEIVRVKNKLKIMYTDLVKKKLQDLKANIRILNTKTKGSKATYDVTLSDKKNEDGKYVSEVTLKGNTNTDNYSMLINYNLDGVDSEVQLDLEEKSRSR